jgi:hypothetical protein
LQRVADKAQHVTGTGIGIENPARSVKSENAGRNKIPKQLPAMVTGGEFGFCLEEFPGQGVNTSRQDSGVRFAGDDFGREVLWLPIAFWHGTSCRLTRLHAPCLEKQARIRYTDMRLRGKNHLFYF